MVLAGGWMHPPADSARALTAVVAAWGMDAVVVTDPTAVAGALAEPCDLLAVSACWFSMAARRYTDEQRAAWAVGPDPRRDGALLDAIDGGTPLLAVHTAVLCFDGWDPWTRCLGGRWNWGNSFHPAPTEIQVTPEPAGPLTFEPFTVVDEEYQGLDLDPQSVVVGRSAAGHPLIWLREDGRRRAAVSVLGHDRRSLDHLDHRALLNHLVGWAVRAPAHG